MQRTDGSCWGLFRIAESDISTLVFGFFSLLNFKKNRYYPSTSQHCTTIKQWSHLIKQRRSTCTSACIIYVYQYRLARYINDTVIRTLVVIDKRTYCIFLSLSIRFVRTAFRVIEPSAAEMFDHSSVCFMNINFHEGYYKHIWERKNGRDVEQRESIFRPGPGGFGRRQLVVFLDQQVVGICGGQPRAGEACSRQCTLGRQWRTDVAMHYLLFIFGFSSLDKSTSMKRHLGRKSKLVKCVCLLQYWFLWRWVQHDGQSICPGLPDDI